MQKNKMSLSIYQSALLLFQQQGWLDVTIAAICAQAGVSRVTFYKYYRNKREVLKEILVNHHLNVCAELHDLAEHKDTLADVITGIYALQQQALNILYSPAMRHDLLHHQDPMLKLFFDDLAARKYAFMNQFFQQLRQKKLLNATFPLPLLAAYLKLINDMMRHPDLQAEYADNIRQLPQDMIQLMMYGLAYRETSPVATKA